MAMLKASMPGCLKLMFDRDSKVESDLSISNLKPIEAFMAKSCAVRRRNFVNPSQAPLAETLLALSIAPAFRAGCCVV